jgi:predicted TIM-barrel fold metal-dependent hydrolase
MIADAHCHFFSPRFFSALSTLRGRTPPQSADDLCRELQWDAPGDPTELADRWVRELDAHGVSRAALIGSIPGDEDSVAAAVARHPSRFIGFCMVDPSAANAVERARRAVAEADMRGICLFPAMHHVPLGDERVADLIEVAASHAGTAVFVHCGVLSVGVRGKLGLPSRFDLRLGDPLALATLAMRYPSVPFIVPHFGAGLFREALMLADSCPNVYFDTSSSNTWIRYVPALTLEAVFLAALSVMGPSRLLFGTDSSFFPRGWQTAIYERQRAALGDVGVSDRDAALIFGGNFDRLFPVTMKRAGDSRP